MFKLNSINPGQTAPEQPDQGFYYFITLSSICGKVNGQKKIRRIKYNIQCLSFRKFTIFISEMEFSAFNLIIKIWSPDQTLLTSLKVLCTGSALFTLLYLFHNFLKLSELTTTQFQLKKL